MKLRDLAHRVRKRVSKPKDNERLEERLENVSPQGFGLFVLNDAITSSADAVDLVAVHGLGGHRTRTWQHPETRAYWLQEFVPADIKNARVVAYGYNSAVAFSKSTAGVEDFARDMLERLKTVRQDSDRPIIFICHSMGGLVVKKALILAHERRHIYGTIADATVGTVFLATPHRGSGFAAPAELASRLFRAAQFGTRTNTKLVTSLRQNAEVLWDISCQFVDRASGIHIRTFYETEPLPFMGSLIVDKNSAVLHHPNEVSVPTLNKNHRTICQFSHPSCESYALVRVALQELRSKAASRNTGPTPDDETIARIFHKSAYAEYKASVRPPTDGTCVWFLQESQYVAWLQSPSSSLLRISGDPGCGKTTLAAFLTDSICQHLSSRGVEHTVAYFFFDGNIAAQSDGTALLLALIHQLLKANPALAPLAEKYLALNNAQIGLSFHNLCEIFRAIVSGPKRKPSGVVCVVDALDECEAASITKAIRFLASIIFSSSSSGSANEDGWLKLAVTSRHNQPIDDLFRTLPSHHRIRLADHAAHTASDVTAFIRARCIHLQTVTSCSDAIRRAVENQLAKRSDNTFLWIHLVLDLLETDTDATPRSFESILRSVPDKLDRLYDSILRRSAAPDALLRVLSVIAASRRALTLDEINIALAVRSDDSLVSQVQQRCQFDIARRLYAVCGPFIRIGNGTVSFIHQTAAEFLVRSPDVPRSPVDGGVYRYKACLDVVGVNRCLAEICVVYLVLADVASGGLPSHRQADRDVMDMGEENVDNGNGPTFEETDSLTVWQSRRGGSLFDYAAKHWGTHCHLGNISSSASSAAGHEDHILFTKATALCDTSTSIFRAWFQLYWGTISPVQRFPDRLTPLMLASHMGLPGVMRALFLSDGEGRNQDPTLSLTSATTRPRTSHLRDADSEGWTALHWAVWNGHGSLIDDVVVEILLQQHHDGDSDGDDKDGDPHDIKHHYNKHESIPDQKSGAKTRARVLDIQDKRGLTPLHWAAADGQKGAMRVPLGAGATVDIFDTEGMTPLALAVENEFLGAVKLLLEHGADVNAAAAASGPQSEGTVVSGHDDGYDEEEVDMEQMGEEEEEEGAEE
ncbi:hypothetical protein RB599_001725 [Gaeumannomyces hyphopodioides]